MPTPKRSSEHLRLEIATAHRRGHTPRPMPRSDDLRWIMGDMDKPTREKVLAYYMGAPALEPGAPVPGCSCKECVGEPIIATITAPGSWEKWSALVERARARKIHTVAFLLGIHFKQAGKEFVCSCPFHEDETPSLYLNSEKGAWHCFSCGRGGDGIQLYMEVKKIAFADAVRELAA